jgi:hypothetical protein
MERRRSWTRRLTRHGAILFAGEGGPWPRAPQSPAPSRKRKLKEYRTPWRPMSSTPSRPALRREVRAQIPLKTGDPTRHRHRRPERQIRMPSGTFAWDAPAGRYKIVRYVCAKHGQPMISSSALWNGLMIDHFNPEPPRSTSIFHRQAHGRLAPGRRPRPGISTPTAGAGELWTPKFWGARRRVGWADMTPFRRPRRPPYRGRWRPPRIPADYDKLLST